MITNTASAIHNTHRISRRGYRAETTAHLSIDMPCLHPDVALDDTGR